MPGDPRPIRAELRAGDEHLGLIVGHLPATRAWEPADQNLLELFAAEIGVAIRNAQLFERVASQNTQLLELDAAKDDFLRGVSHNLQTPLTSIRAFAEQLGEERDDRRLSIITEQSERLSRMVRQLADGHPARVGRPPAAGRGDRPGAPGPAGLGGAGDPVRRLHDPGQLARLAGHRRRRPARPGPVGPPRQRREVRPAQADQRRDRRRRGARPAQPDDHRPRPGRPRAGPAAPLRAVRPGRRRQRRGRQRTRPVRLAGAVPGDERRPGRRAAAGRFRARSSPWPCPPRRRSRARHSRAKRSRCGRARVASSVRWRASRLPSSSSTPAPTWRRTCARPSGWPTRRRQRVPALSRFPSTSSTVARMTATGPRPGRSPARSAMRLPRSPGPATPGSLPAAWPKPAETKVRTTVRTTRAS